MYEAESQAVGKLEDDTFHSTVAAAVGPPPPPLPLLSTVAAGGVDGFVRAVLDLI